MLERYDYHVASLAFVGRNCCMVAEMNAAAAFLSLLVIALLFVLVGAGVPKKREKKHGKIIEVVIDGKLRKAELMPEENKPTKKKSGLKYYDQ